MCDRKKIEESSSPPLRGSHYFRDYEIKDNFDPEDIIELVNNVDRIISCVVNDELEELKVLLTTPKRIVDECGTPLLHMAIYAGQYSVFNYLLQLGYDIEETDEDGDSPLMLTLARPLGLDPGSPVRGDYFAEQLLSKGADPNSVYSTDDPSCYTPLHCAINRNYVEVAKMLIARKEDLGACSYSPIQSCIRSPCMETYYNDTIELISMMIYHGAQITAEDVSLSIEKGELEIYELISDYVPASDLRDVTIPVGFLIKAMKQEPKVFRKVCEKIVEIELYECYWRDVLQIKPDNFSWLMQNFEYETGWILREARYFQIFEIDTGDGTLEFFDMIFQSQWRFVLLEKFENQSISRIFTSCNEFASLSTLRKYVIFFLSYGVNLIEEDLQRVFELNGYRDFFKELLQFDVEECNDRYRRYPFCAIDNLKLSCIYEIHKELPKIMENLQKFTVESWLDFLGYSARSQLVKRCKMLSGTDEDGNVINSKVATLPGVPKLQEFARDQSRVFLVQSLGLKSTANS